MKTVQPQIAHTVLHMCIIILDEISSLSYENHNFKCITKTCMWPSVLIKMVRNSVIKGQTFGAVITVK